MPQSINPATESLIQEYAPMSCEQIEDILKRVQSASVLWETISVAERARLLKQAAEVLMRDKERLAVLITREMGKPIRESLLEIEKCAWVCQYYAEKGPGFLKDELLETDAARAYACFEPLGVVLAIMPWNFPFWQAFRFAAPGLTSGNGVVLKHASNVTGCALAIEKIFRDAGYPEDLFRTIVANADDIQKVIASNYVQAATLTGSEPAGSAVASAAGRAIKKTVLELGGSDPYLILEDADLDHAAETCALSRLINTGQTCISAKRFIVANSVKEAFTEMFVARMAARSMGDPMDPETDIGPMAREDLRTELHDQVCRSLDAGAELLLGGTLPDGRGYYYPPTVLDRVRPGTPAAEEELFGPVAAIMTVADTDEAIKIANQSRFGLGSAVFTRDLAKGEAVARQIQAGCCFINDFVKSDPRLPFGGIGKSGYGRELSHYGMREFVNIKTIVVH